MLPNILTSAKENASFSAIFSTSSPSFSEINSPLLFNNFNAFHCFGLWLAVMIMPPSAFSIGTANSTVGVVDKPISIASIPNPCSVPSTMLFIVSPDIRASLPTTTCTFRFPAFCFIHVPNAAVYFTTSIGVKL